MQLEEKIRIGKVTYNLIGVIIHIGTRIKNGHYVYSYKNDEGEWMVIDDDIPPYAASISLLE